ncbi:MAG: MBL fold metallo-hydrolase [Gemmatimonadota bacterium]|nr:MBL fold metallo-hydrolase [Gemmatimonadota bacterium]
MSKIKSFSVGNGDMFYIRHSSDNFTIIDCCLTDSSKQRVVRELARQQRQNDITRFISTHPDQDHIQRLAYLFDQLWVHSFYCVENAATKQTKTADFARYRQLHSSTKKARYIYKGCKRRWMNEGDHIRGSAGIEILWPDRRNQHFQQALREAQRGGSPNNISSIIRYSLNDGVRALWMGDLETELMKAITSQVVLPKADLLFAPDHGRKSGRVPRAWLDKIQPQIIVVGEAPSSDLTYYSGYNTITQNSAGDIVFDCLHERVDIYVENPRYSVGFLHNARKDDRYGGYYLGSLCSRRR